MSKCISKSVGGRKRGHEYGDTISNKCVNCLRETKHGRRYEDSMKLKASK